MAENTPSGKAHDAITMAGITVKAVDQIGDIAAKEIEDTALALEKGALEIGNKLRLLAEAMREHSKTASEYVEAFCNHSTHVVSTIRDLQERLSTEAAKPAANGGDRSQERLSSELAKLATNGGEQEEPNDSVVRRNELRLPRLEPFRG